MIASIVLIALLASPEPNTVPQPTATPAGRTLKGMLVDKINAIEIERTEREAREKEVLASEAAKEDRDAVVRMAEAASELAEAQLIRAGVELLGIITLLVVCIVVWRACWKPEPRGNSS